MTEYFESEKGRELYFKRFKVFADKYRDDPTVFAWELWNEQNTVSANPEAVKRWQEYMFARIAKECPNHVRDVAAATAAVMRREDSMSTGLDHGIAVPHGRDPSIHGIVGAVVLVDNSGAESGRRIADYKTIDDSPVEIIVLTIANDQAQTPYLQLMANISRVLRVDDGYARLLKCQTPQDMKMFFRNAK